MTQRIAQRWFLIILISAIGAIAAMSTDIPSPLRTILTLWFLMVCPGMAFVRLLQLNHLVIEWTLAVALSLALNAVIANVMVYNNIWQPWGGLLFLVAISLIGAAIQIWQGRHLSQ